MAKSILSITGSLLLLALLCAGESTAAWPTGATPNAVAIRCVNAAGNAFESCGGGGGGGGAAQADNSALSDITGMGALYDVTPPTITDGNVGIPRMSSNRNLYVTLRDAAGNERGLNIDASGNVTANITGTVTVGSHAVTNAGTFVVQAAQSGTWNIGSITTLPALPAGSNNIGDVDVLSLVPGTSATSLGKAEDSAHSSGDTGVAALTKRTDTAASSAGTDGDYAALNTDATGRLWTRPTGGVTPANAFAIPSDAITVWSINGCYNGTTIDLCAKASAGNGATDSNTQRVTLSSDSTGTVIATSATAANFLNRPDTSGATGAAPPARANFMGGIGSGATGGFLTGIPVGDTPKTVSVTSATTTLLVTGVSGRHVVITSLDLLTGAANNVALISGTGATCGTGTTGIAGGTTAANGYNFAANGGIVKGVGLGMVYRTTATGDNICVVTSSVGPLAGSLTYAIY